MRFQSLGQAVYGEISQPYQRCHWTFRGNQGQIVTISMRRNRSSNTATGQEVPDSIEVPADGAIEERMPAKGQLELFGAREDRPKPGMEMGQKELPAELLEGLLKQINQATPETDAQ